MSYEAQELVDGLADTTGEAHTRFRLEYLYLTRGMAAQRRPDRDRLSVDEVVRT